ncbi:MAG: hypothetical protein HY438_01300 [DPANN group archaeon]|nr:hypothetical protein [DPANN group archaeon]
MAATITEYELQCRAQKPAIPGASGRMYELYKKSKPAGKIFWGEQTLAFFSASVEQVANSLLHVDVGLAHRVRLEGWHMLPGDKKTFTVEKE